MGKPAFDVVMVTNQFRWRFHFHTAEKRNIAAADMARGMSHGATVLELTDDESGRLFVRGEDIRAVAVESDGNA